MHNVSTARHHSPVRNKKRERKKLLKIHVQRRRRKGKII